MLISKLAEISLLEFLERGHVRWMDMLTSQHPILIITKANNSSVTEADPLEARRFGYGAL